MAHLLIQSLFRISSPAIRNLFDYLGSVVFYKYLIECIELAFGTRHKFGIVFFSSTLYIYMFKSFDFLQILDSWNSIIRIEQHMQWKNQFTDIFTTF